MCGLRKHFKDILKTSLRHCSIYADSWETTAVDRTCWHAAVNNETVQPFCKQTSSMEAKGCTGLGVRSPRHCHGGKVHAGLVQGHGCGSRMILPTFSGMVALFCMFLLIIHFFTRHLINSCLIAQLIPEKV